MAVAQVATINSPNELLNRFMAQLQAALNPVLECPLLNGVLQTVFVPSAAPVDIAHKLARRPQGYIICGRSANAVIFTAGNADNKTIPLQASADVTATIWFF